jgi:large repetitive protein
LGNDLSETTSVSFNGTAAAFEVVSETEITATVPAGAETGEVEVTTPKRILKSNVKFMVTP